MPYKWVEPEVFLRHRDVAIYHTYDEGFLDDPMSFHFTTCPVSNLEEPCAFDVRDLPVPPMVKEFLGQSQGPVDPDGAVVHMMIIRHAIEQGILAMPAEGDRFS